MTDAPIDLIQQVTDILTGDNQHVEITVQATPGGGMLQLTGDVTGLDGDGFVLVQNIRFKSAYGSPAAFPIHLSSIIEIRPLAAEEE